MGARFQDFEEVNLSDSDDTYELSADEFDNGLLTYKLDGGASGGIYLQLHLATILKYPNSLL